MNPQDRKDSPTSDAVRVSVRVRPLNSREKAAVAGAKTSWSVTSSSITQVFGEKPVPANSFSFDHVFEPHVPNSQVYSALAEPVVKSATEGINGVIFAYGQTAAGKTYTMLGTSEDPGVTRRSIAAVFDTISKAKNRQFLLRASYIEIYNEVIRDLLVPGNDNLKIHEDVVTKRVFVDCMEEVVSSPDQVMHIIEKGETTRAVGETNMNDRSSRSHTIFSLKIESREMSTGEADGAESVEDDGVAVLASTLSLVDLAGSERASFTKAQGLRLVEGGHINKSLLTLGTVINKLSSGEQRSSAHIPYRDSKLTRLLQPALGGNARTAIVCAVTPAVLHMEETMSTLKFASRAKKVTNSAKANEFLDDRAKLRRAEKEIALLRSKCDQLKAKGTSSGPEGSLKASHDAVLPKSPSSSMERIRAFEKKFEALLEAVQTSSSFPGKKRKGRKRNHGEILQPSLSNALHLFGRDEGQHGDSQEGVSTDDTASNLRHQLLQVEKRMRQDRQEIECERQGMMAEVDQLVLSTDEAHRARQAAENECARAVASLGRAHVESLVDELVSEAMATSTLTQDLRQTKAALAKLRHTDDNNKKLKESLQTLGKEHADVVKREKRGVGPVLKEVKFLQGKLSEIEKKNKNLREKVAKLSSEKACNDRELKTLERQNKALCSELEKHRNHNSKVQLRVKKEVSEEKKKLQTVIDGMREDIEELTAKIKDGGEELSATKAKLQNLQQEHKVLSTAHESLQTKAISSESALHEAESLLAKSRESEAAKAIEVDSLTDEVGRVQLELEETKSEVSALLKDSELLRTKLRSLDEAKQETESELLEERNSVAELKASLSSESSARESALLELSKQEGALLERTRELTTTEALASKCEESLRASKTNLLRERIGREKLQKLVDGLEEELKSIRAAHEEKSMECKGLHEQLAVAQDDNRKAIESQTSSPTPTRASSKVLELREHVETLKGENSIRAREVLKLQEVIQARDGQIYGLKEQLDELSRGEGAIAVLQKRVGRRDVVIKELYRSLDVHSKLLQDGCTQDKLLSARRLLDLEAQNAALLEEKEQKEVIMMRLEKERLAMIEESRRLREKIKEKDMARVRDAVVLKEKQYDEVRRKNQALRERPVNRRPAD